MSLTCASCPQPWKEISLGQVYQRCSLCIGAQMSAEPVELFLHFSMVISMRCTGFSHIFVTIIYIYCLRVFLFGDMKYQFWAVLMPKSLPLFPYSWGCLFKLSLSQTGLFLCAILKPRKPLALCQQHFHSVKGWRTLPEIRNDFNEEWYAYSISYGQPLLVYHK